MALGVHAFLDPHCHQKIIFTKFNLKIHYPSPYEIAIWQYRRANTDHIRTPLDTGRKVHVHKTLR